MNWGEWQTEIGRPRRGLVSRGRKAWARLAANQQGDALVQMIIAILVFSVALIAVVGAMRGAVAEAFNRAIAAISGM